MLCTSCRQLVVPAGVFPGGTMACPFCQAELRIQPLPEATADPASPYRRAARTADQGATEPAAPARPRAETGTSSNRGVCPRCAPAKLVSREGDLLCVRCGGLFVGHAHLKALVEAHREGGRRPPPGEPLPSAIGIPVSYLPCPLCKAPMSRKNFGGRSAILVDVCIVHGVWLDRGELDALVAFAFDLPEDAEARAALLALVWQALPTAPARSQPLLPGVGAMRGGLVREAAHVEGLLGWMSRWFG